MDIHERNNHLECKMNNEGTRSHYISTLFPPNTDRPLSCCPNPLLRAGLPLAASRGNEIAVSHQPASWPEGAKQGAAADLGTNRGNIETLTVHSKIL